MGTYGQDWASYQSATPDTSGLGFAFVKITEGLSYINPVWRTQRDHAKANGLVWGAYHYPHMANSPQAEADYFLRQVNWQSGDLVVLDWEGYDPSNVGVPKSTQAAYKTAWLKYVKAQLPNLRVGMYANTDYWRNVDQDGYYGDFLWIATAGRTAGDPGIQAPWLFHQYSESGGLDRDYCHLDAAALRAWALGNQTPEDDMPLSNDDKQAVSTAVWDDYSMDDPTKPGVQYTPIKSVLWFAAANAASSASTVAALDKKIDALAATVASLKTTGLSPDQITAIANAVADVQAKRLES
ncbi:glycoside hydrolase family 25 protein [Streptomyces sp. ASQP_92]|uniref:glycoside hydrolase family 25 protein n=1 Tax=Streptomyces sp. ASQP_92 TaxID=2979116 RepID=UPI0021BFE0D1|nr:glycoside hydrolase family 25 protein [Streptomyces sp. ASQP_92]MCT9092834.1 glycoside hydrolase family 25 protein [Streptomyces sp. ASQP_92]